jgi:secreted trypsin-like serine protease
MARGTRLAPVAALAVVVVLAPATANAQAGGSAQPRIVDGTTASISTYPWQAAVVYAPSKKPGQDEPHREICGGELITSRIVMTAGHCVADSDPDCTLCGEDPVCTVLSDPSPGDGTCKLDPDDVDVILGRSTLTDHSQGAEMTVQAVKLGTSFNGDYQGDGVPRFDAGYLVLSAASGQTPIKIAGTDEGALWDAGSPEEISGWGSISESGTPVNSLRAATVNVIDDSTCSGDYGSDFDATTMICAGFQGGGADTCFGDSGGPLQAPLQGGGDRLVGITGWGEGCGEAGAPGVYTRIAGPTMRSLIAADVSSLETAQGLPQEGIFGSGGQPRTSIASVGSTAKAAASKARKKCKRIRNKKKRHRCLRKAKARSRAAP